MSEVAKKLNIIKTENGAYFLQMAEERYIEGDLGITGKGYPGSGVKQKAE